MCIRDRFMRGMQTAPRGIQTTLFFIKPNMRALADQSTTNSQEQQDGMVNAGELNRCARERQDICKINATQMQLSLIHI
eukprot:7020381-Alexandrium_andersonii.AAC.1